MQSCCMFIDLRHDTRYLVKTLTAIGVNGLQVALLLPLWMQQFVAEGAASNC